MDKFLEDLNFGFRTLVSNPTYSFIAILTLALGIGVNTAMFTLVNGVLLKPLPFPESEQVVLISTYNVKNGEENRGASIEFFEHMVKAESPLQAAAFYAFDQASLEVGDQQKPFTMLLTRHNYLSMFGIQPALGRLYDENDIDKQAVVISYDIWQQEFAGDPKILERVIRINKLEYEVIGVMPEGYSSTAYATDFWRPIDQLDRPVNMVARLAPGLSIDQALTQSAALQRLVDEYSGDGESVWEIRFESMLESIVGDSRPGLYLLLAAVGAVFLIAVLNVVNLTFAQYTNRIQELAVRVALGASKRRLVRQLFTESLLLSAIGGAIGLLLAAWTLEWIRELMMLRLPRLNDVGLDQGAALTTLMLIALSAVLTSLIPAQTIVDPNRLADTVKQAGGKMTVDKRSLKVRRILVAGEVCVAVVLLISAGLLLRSYQKLAEQDPGFDATNIVTGHIWLPDNFKPQPSRSAYWLRLVDELKTHPDVIAVAATSTMPMGRTGIDFPVEYTYPGAPQVPQGQEPSASVRTITPGYFSLLNVPIIAGREFDDRDTKTSPKVVAINQKLAESNWPDENPVGNILSLPDWMGGDHTVVGVVSNVKHRGLRATEKREFFLPVTQLSYPGMSYLVKTRTDNFGQVTNHMLRTSVELESTAPMILVTPLAELTSDSIASERLLLMVLGVFAGIALFLASIGVYGISDNMVRQRTHEIGIRMAIGAAPDRIKYWIIKDTSGTVLVGAMIGLLVAVITSQFVASRLYGVSPMDPLVYACVPIVLVLVGILATWIPANRATQVHPQQALHYE